MTQFTSCIRNQECIWSLIINLNLQIVQLSSPSNGAHTIEEEGYFSMDPGNPLYGDMHFYVYNKVNNIQTKILLV